MIKIGQILFPGNKYRLLAPESVLELDEDGGTTHLTELELLEFICHGRSRDVGVFRRENGELIEAPAHAFDPRPAKGMSKLQGSSPILVEPTKKRSTRKKTNKLQEAKEGAKKKKQGL